MGKIDGIDPAFLEQLQQMPTVEDVIRVLTQQAILNLEAGNVYVGEFGRNIIRESSQNGDGLSACGALIIHTHAPHRP